MPIFHEVAQAIQSIFSKETDELAKRIYKARTKNNRLSFYKNLDVWLDAE